MVIKIKGRLAFSYSCPTKNKNGQSVLKMKLMTSLLVIIAGVFLLPNSAWLSSITPEKLIELTNQERLGANLNALTANQLLTKAAIEKANAIFETQTFKHNIEDKKFSSWIKEANYNYSYVGENLAIDFITAEGIMEAWKNSPSHKKNLLNPYYQEIGIAAIEGEFDKKSTIIVVQIFGSPPQASVQTQISNNDLYYSTNQPMLVSSVMPNPQLNLLESKKLLTHSISNQLPLPSSNNKLSLKNNPQNIGSKMNKFFEQYYYLTFIYYFIIIYFSITIILLLLYSYYLSIRQTMKIAHA